MGLTNGKSILIQCDNGDCNKTVIVIAGITIESAIVIDHEYSLKCSECKNE